MSKAFTYPYECLKSTDYKTWQILTHTEANEKFARNYNFEEFTSIRYILNTTFNARNILLENTKIKLPFRPVFCIITHLSTHGCNKWTQLLKVSLMQKSKITHYENNWTQNMVENFEVGFWQKAYSNVSNLNFDNKIKNMQYTINRGTLKTNRIISKFKAEVSELCSFCNTEIETISHLFHSCSLVREFLRNVNILSL